ncbi:MAG: exopolysaccharide transport family protein [Hyphomicrobiales bacterium]
MTNKGNAENLMNDWGSFDLGKHNEHARPQPKSDASATARHGVGAPVDGLLDPIAFLRMIGRNFFKIIILTVLLTTLGVVAFKFVSFPYTAKAIVLVDPRQQGVKVSEQVVGDIGGDAAVLESIIEILNSDGFLRPLIKQLKVSEDPQYKNAISGTSGDTRLLLAEFKKSLKIQRLGATYVIEIFFTSNDAEKSAFYANAVAKAFVEQQKDFQTSATADAANSLSERLIGLRKALQQSEEAVAQFRSRNNIISVDNASTLLQRELQELSAQVAIAKTASEVARSQYNQIRKSSPGAFNTSNAQSETQQLQALQLQKSTITQSLAQLNLTFGNRHPRIAAEQSRLNALDRQIEGERRRLISSSKQRLDASVTTLNALEKDMAALSSKANAGEEQLVILSELEREASANRAIFEDFLGRFKSAEKQQGLQGQEAKIASLATPPLRSTRPSLALVGGVWGLLSFALSILIVASIEARTTRGHSVDHNGVDYERAGAGDGPSQDPHYVDPALAPAMASETPPPPLAWLNKPRVQNHQPEMPAQNIENTKPTVPEAPRTNFEAQTGAVAERLQKINAPHSTNLQEEGRSKKSTINPYTPILPNLMAADFASLFDMERALASHMKSLPLFKKNRMPRLILVGSWMPQEGKSFVSQSISHLATINGATAAIIKTPYNGEVERRAGIDHGLLERPYDFIDPEAMSTNRQQSMVSFAGFKALLKASLQSYDVVVIDAATVQEEADFEALSSLADATFLLLDRPQQEEVPRVVERTIEAGLSKVQILLNRI